MSQVSSQKFKIATTPKVFRRKRMPERVWALPDSGYAYLIAESFKVPLKVSDGNYCIIFASKKEMTGPECFTAYLQSTLRNSVEKGTTRSFPPLPRTLMVIASKLQSLYVTPKISEIR